MEPRANATALLHDGGDSLIRNQLDRLLGSRTFAGALRLQKLLKFIVEEAVAGRAGGLKEQVIALDVYGRGTEFDPASHSLVRVDVRRLRDKIREYYESEGASDRIRLEIPKGAYCPRFLDLHQHPSKLSEFGSQLPSLAVLPITNLSSPEHEYFADGFTEALITELARYESVRVISRTSVMRYRQAPKPVHDMARELNVRYLVTGSVIQQGERVRFTCQLVQAEPESHVWAEMYELDLEDISAMQAAVARTLVSCVAGSSRTALQSGSTRAINSQAYDAVLKGRHHWNRLTPQDLQKSLEYFRAAIAHDPLYAAAYAGLADANLWLGVLNLIPHSESYLKARAASEKALQIDPNNTDAWHTLGCVAGYAWEWEHAESCFTKSISLNPNFAAAHMSYGSFLAHMGRFEEAIRENRLAHTLDPLASSIEGEYGMILIEARQFEEAVRHLRRMIRADPRYFLAHFHLGRAHIYEKRFPQAVEALEKATRLAPIPDCFAVLAYAYAKAGNSSKAGKCLEQVELLARTDDAPAFLLAVAVLGSGDRERAIAYLEKAYEQRDWLMRLIAVEPGFDELRADPRFIRLVEALRFPSRPTSTVGSTG